MHTVHRGEDFSSIARAYYGSSRLGRSLWWANRKTVPWPGALAVGTRILIPPQEQVEGRSSGRWPGRAQASAQPQVQSGLPPQALAQPLPLAQPPPESRPQTFALPRPDIQPRPALPRPALPRPDIQPRPALPQPSPPVHSPVQAVAGSAAPEGGYAIHVVRPYETLRGIARDRLGDPARFAEIAELNRDLLAAGRFTPGMRLLLPQDARPLARSADR